jgi:hypothetical protein
VSQDTTLKENFHTCSFLITSQSATAKLLFIYSKLFQLLQLFLVLPETAETYLIQKSYKTPTTEQKAKRCKYTKEEKNSHFLHYAMLGIFLFTAASRTALGPTQPPIQWVPGAPSLGVKWPGREADHSPSSSAVKNAWSYTSIPPVHLHGMVLT